MMEGILSQRVTPLLKCIVLFLFIFTAKVLTSRPQDSQELRNDIHQLRPSHYVRTFTKYHHRRTKQWNNLQDYYWTIQDHPNRIHKRNIDTTANYHWLDKYINKSKFPGPVQEKKINKRSISNADYFVDHEVDSKNYWPIPRIRKRSVSVPNSNEFIGAGNLNQLSDSKDVVGSSLGKSVGSGKMDGSAKNGLTTETKTKENNKTPTGSPPISCLYKLHRVSISATPSYEEEQKNQMMVENYSYDIGQISETTLPNGDVAQVEQCTDSKATCYALWHRHSDGNITILGQGCWHSSQRDGRNTCDRCTPIDQVQGIKFCCCTKPYCNADFLSLKEETVTIKAESTMESSALGPSYSPLVASALLALACVLVKALLVRRLYCRRPPRDKDASEEQDLEKGDVMGSGPDALATGLLCVDNLTLIEHIGQGKFGSVWRGSLGSTPVAVKLYSNANAWQKEAAIYALPHLSHSNILKYYGSDTRPTLTEGGGREHLLVLELCWGTLRSRLERSPVSWLEFATLAHGLASALAHLHTPTGNKPCVVHRDVNSNNVLVSSTGQPRLADLGLAQLLHPRRESAPSRITEAGTLRYLSPEALEGALDLSGARAALCAVDVFALGLVVWEALWRCRGAHAGPAPPYALPYQHHGLPHRPSLQQVQTLVSRNKARPPLPKGPVPEGRALKIATDTCDECWDHDAEARLTAVCVEERMSELRALLQAHAPLVHDNNLHPHTHPHHADVATAPEPDKNSNCTSSQTCDVTTPLLYPQPHIGRNACIERNTHVCTSQADQLVHKSLKDITVPEPKPPVEENCLSVARLTRMPPREHQPREEARSYQRPLDYVQNDVSSVDERAPKQTNLLQEVKVEKPKWGIRRFFDRLNKKMDTEVKLVPETSNSSQNGKTKTSIIEKQNNYDRPTNLVLNQDRIYSLEGPCTLSPPNRTLSPTMMIESDLNRENKVFGFKELPSESDPKNQNQIFAVIVPKAKPVDAEIRSKTSRESSESINKFRTSMSSQSIFKSGHSESEDSTVKKRLSCDNKIISSSGRSSRASINLELQYINAQTENYTNDSPFDLNSDCSSSEDEHLMLLSENGNKITMQAIPKTEGDKRKFQNDVLKEASQVTDFGFNKFHNKYANFDNEFSDPNDKENSVNGYSGDNPVYLAALNGEIDTADLKFLNPEGEKSPKSPKPSLKSLSIKRQHSLEQVSEIFSSSGDLNLQNPAGRVKTPGDLPVAVRRARRDRALQKGRASECNRLSLYDDRMMFGNSL